MVAAKGLATGEGPVCAEIIDLDAAPPTTKFTRELGRKYYELSDHLGNPRVIITDRLLSDVVNGTPGKYRSDIVGYSNQYPYGMEQPGRYMNGSGYRYGYNGMERDSAVTGGHHTTYFRQYDARLGRFWSTDPLTHSWESPYVAMGGNPIALVDPSGAEPGDPDEQGRGATQGGPEDEGPEDPPVGPLREGTVYTDQNDATWVWQRNTAGEHAWVRGVMVTALRELPIPNMVQPNLMQGWLASNKWKLEAGDPTNTRSYQVEHARQEQRRMVMNVASYYPMMGVQGTGLATSYLAGLAYDGAYGLRDDLYVLATDRAHQAGLSETPALHLNGQMATGQERLDAHMSAYITAFTLFTPSGVARAGRGVTAAGEGSAVAAAAEVAEVQVAANNAGKIPWGFWDDYAKVTVNGRTYARVGDRFYTRHAIDRMTPSRFGTAAGGVRGRSISPNFIEDVLTSPYSTRTSVTGPAGEVRISHRLGTLQVITENDIVITIITH